MNLDEYFDKFGISPVKFAKIIGVSTATMYNILARKADIRLSTAVTIEEITKGQVEIKELLPQELLEAIEQDLLVHKNSYKK